MSRRVSADPASAVTTTSTRTTDPGQGDPGLADRFPDLRRPDEPADIVDWSAAELSVAIDRRLVSCVEVMTAYLDRIDLVNPRVNAIVALRPRADLLREAAEKDEMLAAGQRQGWMHGFPHAVKDMADVKGIPTSLGFFRPPFAAAPATADSVFVDRLRAAGCIFVGKTNNSEFGLGSHSYNEVYGTTVNAYDQRTSAGGSSGGAAVAVALHMVPVADGSDFFGSLRNPPGWNNVYGLRPSFGRVPGAGAEVFLQQGGTEGPIARNPLDLTLLLRTMSGPDRRAPLSLEQPLPPVPGPESASLRGLRIAWLGDLGGYLPMDPEVLAVCTAAVDRMRAQGAEVVTVDDLPARGPFVGNHSLWPTWLIFRHWQIAGRLMPLYENPALRPAMKPEAVYEIEGVLGGTDGNAGITAMDVWDGSFARSAMYQAFQDFFDSYDYALLPTAQIFPFEATIAWPKEIQGVEMSSYHRWMEVTAVGTLIGAPTAAVPAGFSAGGLPIGLQVMGRHHDDAGVLSFCAAWHASNSEVESRRPPLLG